MALQNELEVLEDLVFENLHPKQLLLFGPDVKQLAEWKELLIAEKKRIRKNIRKYANGIVNSTSKTSYLQIHQTGITKLLDAVFHYLAPKDVSDLFRQLKGVSIENLYKELYQLLTELFHYIKDNYPKHFDVNGKMPDGVKWGMEESFSKKLKTIRQFLKRASAKPSFIELICEPFEYFLSINNEISYRELYYLQELQDELILFAKQSSEDVIDQITERLLYLNFNSVLFFNYYILKISDEVSKKDTVNERVDYLSWQIKIINQTIVKPNVIYLQQQAPIREQLIFWIAEDLYYLDKKHQLSLVLPVSREVEKNKLKKVHVQLTVADLALGAKLLLDTEVIVNMNYTELMKLVARGFRTNRQSNISQQAIYNVGFEASAASKEKMKTILMKMVRKIGEY